MPNEWYLDTISVDERFRGMGIGSKLLDALPEVAKASGKQALGLNVDFDNPGARKLYASKGFKDVTTMTISGHLYNHMQKKCKITKVKRNCRIMSSPKEIILWIFIWYVGLVFVGREYTI